MSDWTFNELDERFKGHFRTLIAEGFFTANLKSQRRILAGLLSTDARRLFDDQVSGERVLAFINLVSNPRYNNNRLKAEAIKLIMDRTGEKETEYATALFDLIEQAGDAGEKTIRSLRAGLTKHYHTHPSPFEITISTGCRPKLEENRRKRPEFAPSPPPPGEHLDPDLTSDRPPEQPHIHRRSSAPSATTHTPVPESVPSITIGPPDRERESLAGYCRALLASTEYLPSGGAFIKTRVPLRVEDLFVDPLAQVQDELFLDKQKLLGSGSQVRALSSSTVLLEDTLSIASRLGKKGVLLFGDPGCGKTTFLKHLTITYAHRLLREITTGAPLPVIISTSQLLIARPLMDILADSISRHDSVLGHIVAAILPTYTVLVMIDGLDEIQSLHNVPWLLEQLGQWPNLSCVMTSRYTNAGRRTLTDGRLLEVHIKPFDDTQIMSFVRKWDRALSRTTIGRHSLGVVDTGPGVSELLSSSRGTARSEDLRELATNPLLLHVICSIHEHRDLDQIDKTQLYQECIGRLLQGWQRERSPLSCSVGEAFGILQAIALSFYDDKERISASREDLTAIVARYAVVEDIDPNGPVTALNEIIDRTGVLIEQEPDRYAFLHKSFGEFLVARNLQDRMDIFTLTKRFGDPNWFEIFRFSMGLTNPGLFDPFVARMIHDERFGLHPEWIDEAVTEAVPPRPGPFVRALRGGVANALNRYQSIRVLRAMGPSVMTQASVQQTLTRVLAVEHDTAIRALLGEVLLTPTEMPSGDGEELVSGSERIDGKTEITFVCVPSGAFMMGASDISGAERPVHQVRLSAFWMSKYPVTNRQYKRFLEEQASAQEPIYWRNKRFDHPDQPVVGISWDEANDFCNWASLALPTEAQWEFAARGTANHSYPWGEDSPTPEHANFEGHTRGTSVVGSFPRGRGPFGTMDQCGNVWEWCADSYHEDAYKKRADLTVLDPIVQDSSPNRAVRGGSWDFGVWSTIRPACRARVHRAYKSWGVGFRVVTLLTSEGSRG